MTSPIRYSFFLTISLIVFSILALSSMAQDYKVGSPSASALAAEFHSGDPFRISQAIDRLPYYEDVYEDSSIFVDVDPYVAKGIISALDNQLDMYLYGDLEYNEEHFFESVITPLATYLTRINDRDAIPILLRASEISSVSHIALAEFGPDIVPIIIDYMHSDERTLDQITGAFYPLTNILHLWRPLDAETHGMLRQLAIDYIQGYVPEHLIDHPRSNTFKSDGAFLASVLGDADLKPMVEALSSEFPMFIELYLEQWYDPSIESVDSDQIDEND